MINVCLFNTPHKQMDLKDFHIESFDPLVYFDSSSRFFGRDFIANVSKRRALI